MKLYEDMQRSANQFADATCVLWGTGIELHNSVCTGHVRAGCDITLIMRTSQTCEDFVTFCCCCVFLGEISDSDSLFYYEAGEDHDSLSDPDYVPAFSSVINPDVDQALVLAVCGSDQFCIFDFQTTGSETFAQSSVQTFQQYEAALESKAIGKNLRRILTV